MWVMLPLVLVCPSECSSVCSSFRSSCVCRPSALSPLFYLLCTCTLRLSAACRIYDVISRFLTIVQQGRTECTIFSLFPLLSYFFLLSLGWLRCYDRRCCTTGDYVDSSHPQALGEPGGECGECVVESWCGSFGVSIFSSGASVVRAWGLKKKKRFYPRRRTTEATRVWGESDSECRYFFLLRCHIIIVGPRAWHERRVREDNGRLLVGECDPHSVETREWPSFELAK